VRLSLVPGAHLPGELGEDYRPAAIELGAYLMFMPIGD
jgi:hypothetical protein